MTKLSMRQKDFLRLIERSPAQQDGWRQVSKVLTPVTKEMIAENPELYETRTEGEVLHVRLSQTGQIVTGYL